MGDGVSLGGAAWRMETATTSAIRGMRAQVLVVDGEALVQCFRQGDHTVSSVLAVADGDGFLTGIQVCEAEVHGLPVSEAAAMLDLGDPIRGGTPLAMPPAGPCWPRGAGCWRFGCRRASGW